MPSTTKKSMPWGLVIFLLILLGPFGLIFLFRKIRTDKSVPLTSGKTPAAASFVLMSLGAIGLLASISGGMPSGFVISATWLGGGIWINEVSKRMKLTGTRYRKYIAIIANEGQKSIDAIASAMGVAYAVAVSDLQQMIDLGFLVDAHIDTESREIHLAKAPPPPREPETPPVPEAPVAQAQERVVACNGCGANKRVSAQVGECEYCGSPLQ